MKFFLDHDVPRPIRDVLQRHGHEAVVLPEVMPQTSADDQVFAYAVQHGMILVTCNRDDFLKLARNVRHHGLIILIRRQSAVSEQGHILRLLDQAGHSGIRGNINFA